MKRLVVAVLVAIVAGCGVPGPTPSAVRTIPLATQPPPGTVTPEVCMAALLSGTLALDPQTGLGVAGVDVTGKGRQVMPVRWPYGWMALDTAPVTLTDADGTVIAHVGDQVAIGGGAGGGGLGVADTWEACPYDIKVVP